MYERNPVNCILPPHILLKLLDSKDKKIKELALHTLLTSAQLRAQRAILGLLSIGTPAGEKRRTIYDARNGEPDPPSGTLARGEGDAPVSDQAINDAYDGLGATYDSYQEIHDR